MADKLLHALLVFSVSILLVCAIRLPARRAFGARLAYWLWATVPITIVLLALPSSRLPNGVQQVVAPLRQLTGAAASTVQSAAAPWQQWIVLIWLAVCSAMMLRLWFAHARYLRSLGPLLPEHDILYSAHAIEGPAVIGLWKPDIVVPSDFRTRYTPQEQELILAHEMVHVHRRDPLANSLCALLQCAFWFHPLVHLAARCFRFDQEMACDAVVMDAHPGHKRSYAEAMLKTQLSAQGGLIHCHWQSTHPLKERIMQLQQIPPQKFRKLLGRITIAALAATCGYAALAANAATTQANAYMIDMRLTANGESSSPRLQVQEGVPFAVASEGKDGAWRTELMLSKASASSVYVKALIKHGDHIVGNPSLMVPIGETAAVAVKGNSGNDDFKLQLTVPALKR